MFFEKVIHLHTQDELTRAHIGLNKYRTVPGTTYSPARTDQRPCAHTQTEAMRYFLLRWAGWGGGWGVNNIFVDILPHGDLFLLFASFIRSFLSFPFLSFPFLSFPFLSFLSGPHNRAIRAHRRANVHSTGARTHNAPPKQRSFIRAFSCDLAQRPCNSTILDETFARAGTRKNRRASTRDPQARTHHKKDPLLWTLFG